MPMEPAGTCLSRKVPCIDLPLRLTLQKHVHVVDVQRERLCLFSGTFSPVVRRHASRETRSQRSPRVHCRMPVREMKRAKRQVNMGTGNTTQNYSGVSCIPHMDEHIHQLFHWFSSSLIYPISALIHHLLQSYYRQGVSWLRNQTSSQVTLCAAQDPDHYNTYNMSSPTLKLAMTQKTANDTGC